MSASAGSRLRRGRRVGLQTALLVAAVLLVAANLRPAITVVGPLVGSIRADTGLSAGVAGLVTTIPILAFGVVSVAAAALARRFGLRRCLACAMAVLAIGIVVRSASGTGALMAGTLVLGLGLATANVLVPSVVKLSFPHRLAAMTGLYAGVMGIAAAIGSGVAVPLADWLPGGWRAALGIWAIPAALAALAWLVHREPRLEAAPTVGPTVGGGRVWSSAAAWWVTGFFGLQAAGFYVTLTWLPSILVASGMSASRAGGMLFLLQAAVVVGVVGLPQLAGRASGQSRLAIGVSVVAGIGIGGLIAGSPAAVELWVVILGFAQGGALGLGLMFVVLRARDAHRASELSGMAQGLGYSLAALWPVLAGATYDATGNWDAILVLLLALAAAQLATAWRAGAP